MQFFFSPYHVAFKRHWEIGIGSSLWRKGKIQNKLKASVKQLWSVVLLAKDNFIWEVNDCNYWTSSLHGPEEKRHEQPEPRFELTVLRECCCSPKTHTHIHTNCLPVHTVAQKPSVGMKTSHCTFSGVCYISSTAMTYIRKVLTALHTLWLPHPLSW